MIHGGIYTYFIIFDNFIVHIKWNFELKMVPHGTAN